MSGRFLLACAALLLWSTAATALEVFRWRDADGTLHFTDQPHPGAARLYLPDAGPNLPDKGVVARVIDGDTLVLESGRRVRLSAINAPEVPYRGRPGEPGGLAAKAFLAKMLTGRPVTLSYGRKTTDGYDRLIAQLRMGDGTDVGRRLIDAGHAWVVPRPPNLGPVAGYFDLEREARARRRGLWSRPRYAVQPVERAPEFRNSFRRLRGRLDRVAGRAGRAILHIGPLRAQVTEAALPLFRETDWRRMLGKRIVVRGWIGQHEGRPALRLRHPLQIESVQ